MVDAFQVWNVFEDERIVDGDLTTNPLIHGVHKSLPETLKNLFDDLIVTKRYDYYMNGQFLFTYF